MQLPFKAIARAAGYRASSFWHSDSKARKWTWATTDPYESATCVSSFNSEEGAYKDCCAKAGLVRCMINGDVVP